MRLVLVLSLSTSLGLVACGADDPAPSPQPTPSATPTPSPAPQPLIPGCVRGTIEPDLMTFGPLAGPGVDPVTGQLRPPPAGSPYIVSSTYLALRGEPAAQQTFGALMGPINQTLQAQAGLLAIQLGTSMSCGTARTLSVWASEEAMYAFVASTAHVDAIRRVGEVSRGESMVTHWTASATSAATWAAAAEQLRDHDGTLY